MISWLLALLASSQVPYELLALVVQVYCLISLDTLCFLDAQFYTGKISVVQFVFSFPSISRRPVLMFFILRFFSFCFVLSRRLIPFCLGLFSHFSRLVVLYRQNICCLVRLFFSFYQPQMCSFVLHFEIFLFLFCSLSSAYSFLFRLFSHFLDTLCSLDTQFYTGKISVVQLFFSFPSISRRPVLLFFILRFFSFCFVLSRRLIPFCLGLFSHFSRHPLFSRRVVLYRQNIRPLVRLFFSFYQSQICSFVLHFEIFLFLFCSLSSAYSFLFRFILSFLQTPFVLQTRSFIQAKYPSFSSFFLFLLSAVDLFLCSSF